MLTAPQERPVGLRSVRSGKSCLGESSSVRACQVRARLWVSSPRGRGERLG